jgi:hypothetical protein
MQVEFKRGLVAEIQAAARVAVMLTRARLKEIFNDYVSEANIAESTRAEYRYTKRPHLILHLGKEKAVKGGLKCARSRCDVGLYPLQSSEAAIPRR